MPASYAAVDYFGVHAFTFTNAAGEQTLVKYHLIPEAGQVGLTPDEAKAKGSDFYADELKERLGKGPVVEKSPHDITIDSLQAFLTRVTTGKPENVGVRAAESTLTTILGRMAIDLHREVTWEEMMNS